MKKKGIGGGNTITGLNFERERDILKLLKKQDGYTIKGNIIFYEGKKVAQSYRKKALYVIVNNTLFIIEMKFQKVAGSVDEKLQTCDFKRKQYAKLMAVLNIEVEYIYILNDWFKKAQYKDTLDYVISVGCQYYFKYLPLQKLGLPVPI